MTLQKGQRKIKVKTIGIVHNFIILANCWNHDRRSMWNSSMSYGVHKVTPVHGTSFLCPCKKVKKSQGQNNRFFVHNFIILLTVETMFEGQSQKVEWVMVSTK